MVTAIFFVYFAFRLFYLKVLARDFGIPTMTAKVMVAIYVQDVKDHPPIFQKLLYKRSIPEDLIGGTSVLEVCLTTFLFVLK